MPNGRHYCAMCQNELIEWDMACPKCGASAEVAEGLRTENADEILQRYLKDHPNEDNK